MISNIMFSLILGKITKYRAFLTNFIFYNNLGIIVANLYKFPYINIYNPFFNNLDQVTQIWGSQTHTLPKELSVTTMVTIIQTKTIDCNFLIRLMH